MMAEVAAKAKSWPFRKRARQIIAQDQAGQSVSMADARNVCSDSTQWKSSHAQHLTRATAAARAALKLIDATWHVASASLRTVVIRLVVSGGASATVRYRTVVQLCVVVAYFLRAVTTSMTFVRRKSASASWRTGDGALLGGPSGTPRRHPQTTEPQIPVLHCVRGARTLGKV